MKEFIYGKLNKEIVKPKYKGKNSTTTNVLVNDDLNEIKVDVVKTPGTLTLTKAGKILKSFDGSINTIIDIPEITLNELDSDTANITIDNEANTIKVDVHKTPGTLTVTKAGEELGNFDGGSDLSIDIPEVDLSNYVTLDGNQQITGQKVFNNLLINEQVENGRFKHDIINTKAMYSFGAYDPIHNYIIMSYSHQSSESQGGFYGSTICIYDDKYNLIKAFNITEYTDYNRFDYLTVDISTSYLYAVSPNFKYLIKINLISLELEEMVNLTGISVPGWISAIYQKYYHQTSDKLVYIQNGYLITIDKNTFETNQINLSNYIPTVFTPIFKNNLIHLLRTDGNVSIYNIETNNIDFTHLLNINLLTPNEYTFNSITRPTWYDGNSENAFIYDAAYGLLQYNLNTFNLQSFGIHYNVATSICVHNKTAYMICSGNDTIAYCCLWNNNDLSGGWHTYAYSHDCVNISNIFAVDNENNCLVAGVWSRSGLYIFNDRQHYKIHKIKHVSFSDCYVDQTRNNIHYSANITFDNDFDNQISFDGFIPLGSSKSTIIDKNKQNYAIIDSYNPQTVFHNIVVNSWYNVEDSDGYIYEACIKPTETNWAESAEIIFNIAEATSGNYSPICECDNDGIKIRSKVTDVITIPTIIINHSKATFNEIYLKDQNNQIYISEKTLNDFIWRQLERWQLEQIVPNINEITDIILPDSIYYIYNNLFEGLNNLNTIRLPKYLNRLSANTFSGSGIRHLVFNQVEYLEDYAIFSCPVLESIKFKDIHAINFNSIYNNYSLREIYLESQQSLYLHHNSIINNPNLEVIYLNTPEGYTVNIEVSAISNCPNLSIIKFNKTMNDWYNIGYDPSIAMTQQIEVICSDGSIWYNKLDDNNGDIQVAALGLNTLRAGDVDTWVPCKFTAFYAGNYEFIPEHPTQCISFDTAIDPYSVAGASQTFICNANDSVTFYICASSIAGGSGNLYQQITINYLG